MNQNPIFFFRSLQDDEVLCYYDRPIVGTMKDAQNNKYLLLLAGEDESTVSYLLTAISPNELQELKEGTLDVREPFYGKEVYFVEFGIGNTYSITECPVDQVFKHLPEEPFFLPTTTSTF